MARRKQGNFEFIEIQFCKHRLFPILYISWRSCSEFFDLRWEKLNETSRHDCPTVDNSDLIRKLSLVHGKAALGCPGISSKDAKPELMAVAAIDCSRVYNFELTTEVRMHLY